MTINVFVCLIGFLFNISALGYAMYQYHKGYLPWFYASLWGAGHLFLTIFFLWLAFSG